MNTVTMGSVLRVRSLEFCHSNFGTTIAVHHECTKRTFLTLREHRFAVDLIPRTLRTAPVSPRKRFRVGFDAACSDLRD
jgi:hypothetical protein